MFAKVDIFNMALGHLGISKIITDVDEESLEAAALRNFYDIARDMIFRAIDWPFARVIKPLALIEETPNEEWNFKYEYPADCALFLKIVTGYYYDTSELKAEFELLNTDTGTAILAQQQEATAQYIKVITQTGMYPPDFVIALSYLLASLAAMSITSGDPLKLGEKNLGLYRAFLGIAAASSKNENHRRIVGSYTPSIQARR